jgi:hypothetical protein
VSDDAGAQHEMASKEARSRAPKALTARTGWAAVRCGCTGLGIRLKLIDSGDGSAAEGQQMIADYQKKHPS